jgi:TetR/AcrR family transcriptional repressor of bet genes
VVRQAPAEKYDERRSQLAESALRTLGELGYARTSLREIAGNSPFSHGVVHYYFDDKLELIIYCVRYYKARCVTRYDAVVAESSTAEELVEAFAAKLVETISDEAPMHRLWYDLRTQSMFDPALRDAVLEIDETLEDMVWRVVERYAELAGRPVARSPRAAYGLLDGIFQQALLGHLTGREVALGELVDEVREVMPFLLSPSGTSPARPRRSGRARRPAGR